MLIQNLFLSDNNKLGKQKERSNMLDNIEESTPICKANNKDGNTKSLIDMICEVGIRENHEEWKSFHDFHEK